jgi:hypothetical protein
MMMAAKERRFDKTRNHALAEVLTSLTHHWVTSAK